MSSLRDRTLSWQPPLWTVINFSIRESHELSGDQSSHILKKMEFTFVSCSLFWTRLLLSCSSSQKHSVSFITLRAAPCVYRKLKHGRSGDEVRPGWRVN